ncbi:MAG: diguanylate cyclase [Kangiellaceae bacterium]
MGYLLRATGKQRLLKGLLLFLLLAWQNGLRAADSLTNFSSEYYPLALLLATDPDQLISKLESENLESKEAVNAAQSRLLLSLAYNQQALPQKAILHAIEGKRLISLESEPWLYHYLLLSQAISLEHQGNQSKSLPLANQVLKWAKDNAHVRLTIQALYTRGLIHNSMLDSANALEDLQQAYTMSPDEDPFVPKGLIAGFIGLIYEYRAEDKQAIPFFTEAVSYHRSKQRWRDLGDAIYGLGRAYKNSGDLDKGKELLADSITIARKVNDHQGVAYGQKELASLFSKIGNKEMAEVFYLRAIESFNIANNTSAMADVTISVASISLDLKNAGKAHQYLDQAEQIIDPKNMLSHLLRLKYYRGKAYEQQGKYELAYRAMMESYPQRLQMLKQQYSERFEQLENQFELNKLDSENKLLEKENQLKTGNLVAEKKRNQFLNLIIAMFVVICLLLVFILIRARHSRLKFQRLSQTDDLTGLSNRRKAVHLLDYQIELAQKHNSPLSVALVDLDYFKQINDKFGHAVGDLVLVEFASLCRDSLRGADIVGRIGGEEFLIGLPQTSLNDAVTILDKLRLKTHDIAKAFNLSEKKASELLEVSISIGVSEYQSGDNSEIIIGRADKALYAAKDSGRDKVIQA